MTHRTLGGVKELTRPGVHQMHMVMTKDEIQGCRLTLHAQHWTKTNSQISGISHQYRDKLRARKIRPADGMANSEYNMSERKRFKNFLALEKLPHLSQ